MFKSPKTILSFSSLTLLLLLTGCTVPGSHLSYDNKKVMSPANLDDLSEQEKQKIPVEQVNVYPLSYSFVSAYAQHNNAILGTARVNPTLDDATAKYEYLVGTGDILNVTIWNHPELTIPAGAYRSAQEAGHWVHADGKIFYPYIGFVSVVGKTVVEIRADISTRIAKFIESPQVEGETHC